MDMDRKPIYKNRKPLRERKRSQAPLLLILGVLLLAVIFTGSVMGAGPQEAYLAPETPDGEETIWVTPDTGAEPGPGRTNDMRQSIICAAEAVDCPEADAQP
jgi:hypothetical protein